MQQPIGTMPSKIRKPLERALGSARMKQAEDKTMSEKAKQGVGKYIKALEWVLYREV